MNECFSEIIFNINCMILEITFIETVWNCARLGLVNKAEISQAGEGRAGRLQLKDWR